MPGTDLRGEGHREESMLIIGRRSDILHPQTVRFAAVSVRFQLQVHTSDWFAATKSSLQHMTIQPRFLFFVLLFCFCF